MSFQVGLSLKATPALFLDRDGVINHDTGFVHTPGACSFIDGIFDVCIAAQNKGYKIIILTNQSGIARGYYTEEQFQHFTGWMKQQFTQQSIAITHVYFCPHHPTEGKGAYKQSCECRKPKPGMFHQAQKDYDIDLSDSIMIGDRESDMEAAQAAGITKKWLYQPIKDTQSSHQIIKKFDYNTIDCIFSDQA